MFIKYCCGAIFIPDDEEYMVYHDDENLIVETRKKIYSVECMESRQWADDLSEALAEAYTAGKACVDMTRYIPRHLRDENIEDSPSCYLHEPPFVRRGPSLAVVPAPCGVEKVESGIWNSEP